MRRRLWAVAVLAFFCLSPFAQTEPVPNLVRISGTVSNAQGTIGITFALYREESGGAPLWVETQSVAIADNGRFTALLGKNHAEGGPVELFTSSDARWLGIQPEGQPEQPRVMFVSVPYAAKAHDSDTLGGFSLQEILASQSLPLQASATNSAITTGSGTTRSDRPARTSGASSGPGPHVLIDMYSPTVGRIEAFNDATNTPVSLAINSAGGNVGVGTVNPTSKLEVSGDIKLTQGSGAGIIFADNTKQTTAVGPFKAADTSVILGGTSTAPTIKVADAGVGTAKLTDGAVTDAKIASMSASKLTGTVLDSQIAAVSGSKIAGTVPNATHATNADTATTATAAGSVVNGVYSTGSYADPAWITSLDAAKLTIGTVPDARLSSAVPLKSSSNTFSAGTQDFSGAAATIPVKSVLAAAAPATCIANKEMLLKTDAPGGQKLFVCNSTGNGWVLLGDGGAGVASFAGRSGSVSPQSGDYNFSQISGTVSDAQLGLISGAKIVGPLADNQIGALSTTKLVGTIADAQVASVSGSKVTGVVPPMNGPYFLNATFPGPLLQGGWVAASAQIGKDITVTRLQITSRFGGVNSGVWTPCWPLPAISISDGVSGLKIPLTGESSVDSGPIKLPYVAGNTLKVQLHGGSSACSKDTAPADTNVVIEYRLQAEGDAQTCPTDQTVCSGVCTSTLKDSANCGSCGNACPNQQGCVNGFCDSTGCPNGQTRCAAGGVCLDVRNDRLNCGVCGNVCATGVPCTEGVCGCGTKTNCSGTCVDTTTSRTNCGGCGIMCGPTQICSSGSCTTCGAGLSVCSNSCVNLMSSRTNCGSCGHVCPIGSFCLTGLCR